MSKRGTPYSTTLVASRGHIIALEPMISVMSWILELGLVSAGTRRLQEVL